MSFEPSPQLVFIVTNSRLAGKGGKRSLGGGGVKGRKESFNKAIINISGESCLVCFGTRLSMGISGLRRLVDASKEPLSRLETYVVYGASTHIF